MLPSKDLALLMRLIKRIPFEQMKHIYINQVYRPEKLDELFESNYWTQEEYFNYGDDPYTQSDTEYLEQEEILNRLNKQ